MPLESHREQASDQAPQVTCIHLKQGSSDDSVWVLEEGVGGTFLTIGSDPECEWQIRAAGMPAHALSVLLVGGLVYVRSGPQRGVRLDGQLLSEDWKQVEQDARIDVGLAQLEIKLGKNALLPSLRDVHAAASAQPQASRPAAFSPRAELYASPHDLERSGMRRAPTVEARGSTHERNPDPRQARHDPRQHARPHPQQLWLDPGSIEPRTKSGWGFLYLVGLIVLGAAYVLWVAWLDNVPWLDDLPWLDNIPRVDSIKIPRIDSIPWPKLR